MLGVIPIQIIGYQNLTNQDTSMLLTSSMNMVWRQIHFGKNQRIHIIIFRLALNTSENILIFNSTKVSWTLLSHRHLISIGNSIVLMKNNHSEPYPLYHDWRDNFLKPTLTNAFNSLRNDRYLLWNIADIKIGKDTYHPLTKTPSISSNRWVVNIKAS